MTHNTKNLPMIGDCLFEAKFVMNELINNETGADADTKTEAIQHGKHAAVPQMAKTGFDQVY